MEDDFIFYFIFNIIKIFSTRNRRDLRSLRNLSDPFNISERSFMNNFRMSQDMALRFIEELRPFDTEHYSNIPFHYKILLTLNFYATGSYQTCVGRNNILNVSQPSVSRIITYVSELIAIHLGEKYIHFPKENETYILKRQFMEEFGIENTIGCIDGSHIAILCPSRTDPDRPPRLYRNRKRFYSINVEAVCDAKLKFLWINPRFPGACHDSGIWAVSPLREHLRQHSHGDWLLGDSGYPLEPWLVTPYSNRTESHEKKFNDLRIKTRNCVERACGVSKAIFRCMLKERTLHYSPTKAILIINACFLTYNYLRNERIVDYLINEFRLDVNIDDDETNILTNFTSDQNIFVDGREKRETYARSLV